MMNTQSPKNGHTQPDAGRAPELAPATGSASLVDRLRSEGAAWPTVYNSDRRVKALLDEAASTIESPMHVLMSGCRVVGWTRDAEWAERWAAQYYTRFVARTVAELSQNRDYPTPR